MEHASSYTVLKIAERLYPTLLLAYPAAYRREYGPVMLQLFRDLCRDAFQQRGVAGFLWLVGCVLVDTAVNAVIEHAEVLKERNETMTPQQHARVIAHAGLPIVLGVVLFLINSNYMSRMLMPNPAQPIGWLMTAVVLVLVSAAYIVERRIFIQAALPTSDAAPDSSASSQGWKVNKEFALAVSSLLLILPAVLLVVLGPAFSQVIEFMRKQWGKSLMVEMFIDNLGTPADAGLQYGLHPFQLAEQSG